MLPTLSDSLKKRSDALNPSGGPKKKAKKQKKSSKKKRKKDRDHSGSDSETGGTSSEEEIWIERKVPSLPASEDNQPSDHEMLQPLQREEWLQMPGMHPKKEEGLLSAVLEHSSQRVSHPKTNRVEKEKQYPIDTPGGHSRELNPYWKDGGTGLPSAEHELSTSDSSSTVGDSGRSWLLKSYKRALELAETTGRSFEEIAEERWGSVSTLHQLLSQAGIDNLDPDTALSELSSFRERKIHHPHTPSSILHTQQLSQKEKHPDAHCKHQHVDQRYQDVGSRKRSRFIRPDSDTTTTPCPADRTTSQAWKKQDARMCSKEASSSVNVRSSDTESSVLTERGFPKTAENFPSAQGSVSKVTSHVSEEVQSAGVSTEDVSDNRLNALSAKIMKAELLGKTEKANTLKLELKALQELKQSTSEPQKNTVVVLTKSDSKGQVWPVSLTKDPYPSGKGKKKKNYFEGGEDSSIREMLHQERMTGFDDTQALIAKMASKFIPSGQSGEVIDDALDSKTAVSYDVKKSAERQNRITLGHSKKFMETLENCSFCFGSKQFKKHLVISVGQYIYLSMPSQQSLTNNHCLLSPLEHLSSSVSLDENIWEELRNFQKAIARMFAAHGLDVVFIESHTHHSQRNHMCIDCIPLEVELGQMAPMYFKKAILESDQEWSMNKKLVETKARGVRNTIPNGLPFFAVEFGVGSGFAHVVEDRDVFPHYFGKEVIGGMLDVEPRLWKKPPFENFEQQKTKVLSFADLWKPFDMTAS